MPTVATATQPSEASAISPVAVISKKQQQNEQQTPSRSPTFWEGIHKIRTNRFEHADNANDTNKALVRKWSFQSRKSHILDTNGHYSWERELNCYQLQKIPESVFPENTLEITMGINVAGLAGCKEKEGTESGSCSSLLRIRFGALEGLRGWISLDAPPIPTKHALGSAHWKYVASQGQLPGNTTHKQTTATTNADESIVLSTSYDYSYTTLYKGGTDVVTTDESNNNNRAKYHYLHPNSTSLVPKHNADENDLRPAQPQKGKGGKSTISIKVRKPICKCKSDGGRKPLVCASPSSSSSAAAELSAPSSPLPLPSTPPTPNWTREENYKVDIEGMIQRAMASAGAAAYIHHNQQQPPKPFLFREDVDLWEDDLHDNGIAWLKARCFVCHEGWACLLRNFVRVDGVLCRVIDTRYSHTFGSNKIYREHSWREGPWEPLVAAIQRNNTTNTMRMGGATNTTISGSRRRMHRGGPPPPTTTTLRPLPVNPMSHECINDSVAARYLPLKGPPVTECLSLDDFAASILMTSTATHTDKKSADTDRRQQQQQQQQLFLINDATIDDAVPVPNSNVKDKFGIFFVLIRSKGRILEAVSSCTMGGNESGGDDSRSVPVYSLWTNPYNTDNSSDATILRVQISPDPSDGGRLAIGDDRGKVSVWRLSTGEPLWEVPVAPRAILKRLERNPYFESARLWVEHVVWSPDGSLLGASAGRNTVLASAHKEEAEEEEDSLVVLSSLESTSGTVTGLSFCKRPDLSFALAVASYGEIRWLTQESLQERTLKTLTREGAAIESIDVSPDGNRIAVGFLDKTLRIFHNFGGTSTKNSSVVDWVGFGAPVKSVRFNATGNWLAAMGGNTILVIRDTLSPRSQPPFVCRTPGQAEADGVDGTCHKFAAIEWSGGEKCNGHVLLAALDAKTKSVHVFRFSKTGPWNVVQDAWPIQVLPVRTVSPLFVNPSRAVATRFAFFIDKTPSKEKEENIDGNDVSFLALYTSTAKVDADSPVEQELESKLDIGNSTIGDGIVREDFSFRVVR